MTASAKVRFQISVDFAQQILEPRLRLDGGELAYPQPVAQVGLIAVDHRDRYAAERCSLRLPLQGRLLPALLKILTARGVVRGIRGVDQREARTQRLGDDRDVVRIECHVRVAQRVDVSHRAVDGGGHLQQRHELLAECA